MTTTTRFPIRRFLRKLQGAPTAAGVAGFLVGSYFAFLLLMLSGLRSAA